MSQTGSFNPMGLNQSQIDSRPELVYTQNLNNFMPQAGATGATVTAYGWGNTVSGAGSVCLGRGNTGSSGVNCTLLGNNSNAAAYTNVIQLNSGAPAPSANHQIVANINTDPTAAGLYNSRIPILLYDSSGDPLGVKYLHVFDA